MSTTPLWKVAADAVATASASPRDYLNEDTLTVLRSFNSLHDYPQVYTGPESGLWLWLAKMNPDVGIDIPEDEDEDEKCPREKLCKPLENENEKCPWEERCKPLIEVLTEYDCQWSTWQTWDTLLKKSGPNEWTLTPSPFFQDWDNYCQEELRRLYESKTTCSKMA